MTHWLLWAPTCIRQSGATYLESGKRYMQSWTGVLSGAMLQHQFEISASFGTARHDSFHSVEMITLLRGWLR